MLRWVTNLIGESSEKEIRKLRPLVEQINDLEPEYSQLSDDELRAKTEEFRDRLASGEPLEDILPEAYAAVREASGRSIGLHHFDVQLMGGMVLHQGKIAEMKTGEGKTLVATLPLYLNALVGEGAHLVTVNDYLAKRDTQWMGPIYHFLGLSVGVIQHEAAFLFDPMYHNEDERFRFLRPVSRVEAYRADITYGTNNEFGFDYLRDNMVLDLANRVQRGMQFAIVDEVDNILIDEARTPLIISGAAEESTEYYHLFARLVKRLREGEDFAIDEKLRAVTLTDEGIGRVERWLGVSNIYDPANYELTRYLEQALKAQYIFSKDRDYVLVKDGRVISWADPEAEVVIVDEFTGRLMLGRRYSEGLHQAIEAKEGVKIRRESRTLATITFQNYFRMYDKLAGMTGTAYTEKEEFQKIYNLDVVVVPTHRPMIRMDHPDRVYKSEEAKFRAVVEEIKENHSIGRPVLVGTLSIEKSEYLSRLLAKVGIPYQVLNAKYHEKEAKIIAQAGRPGTVTIATNMAGRGVDILLGGNPAGLAEERLGKGGGNGKVDPEEMALVMHEVRQMCEQDREKVLELGGVYVLGTERHEARRIDNQLRGRSGRQGDPGSSRFYVSLGDDLMRRFGGSNIASLMDRFGLEEDIPIESKVVSGAIENAQQKVEAYNFDIRKHVVEYDDVMNKHREVLYGERYKVLSEEDLKPIVLNMIHQEISGMVESYVAGTGQEEMDLEGLLTAVKAFVPLPSGLAVEELADLPKERLEEQLYDLALASYEEKERQTGPELMRRLERLVLLHVMDSLWVEHLTALEELREGIGLRAYGQRDPLVEFKGEAHRMFQSLLAAIQRGVAQTIFHVGIQQEPVQPMAKHARTNRGEEGPAEPVRVGKKVGRNDPCPCGSGLKYKKCHGKT